MTGLFTLFRFSRYQSKLFPTTDLQVPELVTQKAGHFTPPIDTTVVFVHKIEKFITFLCENSHVRVHTHTQRWNNGGMWEQMLPENF